jgi:hypothetical protein
MKVRELIELLSKCDPEANALVSDYSAFNCENREPPARHWTIVTRIDGGFSEDPGAMKWDMHLRETSSGYTSEAAVWIVGHAEDDVVKPLFIKGGYGFGQG